MVSAPPLPCNRNLPSATETRDIAYNGMTMRFTQLPNIITISRLAMVPLLILMLKEQAYPAALALFVIAGLSDGLDGFLARRFNLKSHLGGILDPLADKVLMASTYITLTVLQHIPFWLLLVVVSRDFLIIGGYLAVTSQTGAVKMKSSVFSKINTVMQIALVLAILLEQASVFQLPLLVDLLIYIVLITTLTSGAHYYWVYIVKKGVEPITGSAED